MRNTTALKSVFFVLESQNEAKREGQGWVTVTRTFKLVRSRPEIEQITHSIPRTHHKLVLKHAGFYFHVKHKIPSRMTGHRPHMNTEGETVAGSTVPEKKYSRSTLLLVHGGSAMLFTCERRG